MLNARHLASAQLSFLQACTVDAAADTSCAASLQQAAALNGSGSSSSSSICVPADVDRHIRGLALCCTASCGSLYAELVSRWQTAEPHSTAMSNTKPATATAAAPAGSQQPAADAAGSNASGSDNASSSIDGSSLPLPDVGEFGISPWDLRWIVEELDLPAEWRSHAVYKAFQPTPWLQPAAAVSGSSDAAPSSSGSGSSADKGRCALLAAAGAAAAALPGLWRGTYGSHGVEVVQLQLLPVAAGYNLLQQHGVFEGPALRVSDCPRGVLLASVLHTAPPVLHPSLVVPGSLPMPDGHADVPQQQPPQQQQSEAAGMVGAAPCNTVTGRQQKQQPQQLLLVATKVTGDRNVPAGQVTFAVDLASRSTEGTGQPLQLPPGMHSDVKVNAAGTRQLVVKVRETSCATGGDMRFASSLLCDEMLRCRTVVCYGRLHAGCAADWVMVWLVLGLLFVLLQERYSGLAQIADVHFQSPRLIEVQLLVFEGGDCLGLLWRPPMDSFSLLSRLPDLP